MYRYSDLYADLMFLFVPIIFVMVVRDLLSFSCFLHGV